MKKAMVIIVAMLSTFCSFGNDADPTLPDFIERTLRGVYEVTSVVDIVITGNANTELLVCVPYPETNQYQDIMWIQEIEPKLISTFPETGEKFIKYSKHQRDLVSDVIKRHFVFRCWNVSARLDLVTFLYPYDISSSTYKTYTRKPAGENLQIDPSNSWVTAKRDLIRQNTGENVLLYAKEAYALVAAEFEYMTDEPNLETVIANKGGQCGGLTAVVVSLLRSRGIPARPLVCKRPSGSSHVWGEFYLQNYGWVPFDVTQDLGKEDSCPHFGHYKDTCIVMTRDMHQSVSSETGRIKNIKLLQNYSFWYWYSGGTTKVTTKSSIFGFQVCLREGNTRIPCSWLKTMSGTNLKTAIEYEEYADSDLDFDGHFAWQEYVAGTDPTKEDDVFKASITKDKNGKIIISYTPEFKDENEKAKRKYTTLGKKSLMDGAGWEVVPEGHEADYNFFKVTVEMKP